MCLIERTFANREEWLEWRRKGIGSSDGTILASCYGLVTPPKWVEKTDNQSLFWEKLGLGREKAENSSMLYGREMEETVRKMVESRLGFISPVNFERTDIPFMRASLDGLTLDGAIVEIKVPSPLVVAMARNGEIPGYYQAQIAHQLMTVHGHPFGWTGSERWHYAVLDSELMELVLISGVSAELQDLAYSLYDVENAFWGKLASRDVPGGGYSWYSLATEICKVKTKAAQLAEHKETLRSSLVNGTYTSDIFQLREVRASVTDRTDWDGLCGSLGLTEENLGNYRKPPETWSVWGGAQPLSAQTVSPKEAESKILGMTGIKNELEELCGKAYAMAADRGAPLIGPYGMRVSQRIGAVDYDRIVKEFNVSKETIKLHTHQSDVAGYTSLVKISASKRNKTKEKVDAWPI